MQQHPTSQDEDDNNNNVDLYNTSEAGLEHFTKIKTIMMGAGFRS